MRSYGENSSPKAQSFLIVVALRAIQIGIAEWFLPQLLTPTSSLLTQPNTPSNLPPLTSTYPRSVMRSAGETVSPSTLNDMIGFGNR